MGSRDRLRYLWNVAEGALEEGKLETARYYVSELVRLASEHRIPLSAGLRSSLCRRCDVPLVAGVTMKLRLRGRSKRSPASLRTSKRKRHLVKVKSHIVATCLCCGDRRRIVASSTPKNPVQPPLPEYVPFKRVTTTARPLLLLDPKPRKRPRKASSSSSSSK